MKIVYIGRNAENDVVLTDPYVSGRHACIAQNDDGSFMINDLGSKNGTFVNGHHITQSALNYNDIVKLGEYIIPWQQYFVSVKGDHKTGDIIRTYSIGRSAENDIVIADEYVSSNHGFLFITNQHKAIIQDNNSSNGTFVNNLKVSFHQMNPGDEVRLARTPLNWMQYLSEPAKHTVRKKKKKSNTGLILAIILTSLAIIAVSAWLITEVAGVSLLNHNESAASDTVPTFSNLNQLVKYAEKAVFLIETKDNSGRPIAFGTGFFVSSSGIGITNAHVLQRGSSWNIKTSDGKVYSIEDVLKINTTYDYAIFRVNGNNDFTMLKVADEEPEKGQDIIVLGNPQGIESTLTKGIVSGFKGGTEKEVMSGQFSEGNTFIQIDVAISHGSSGSPVMNMKGQVVGIASLSFAEANCVNCNFAVNIDMLKQDLNSVIH
jgi:pSer/pThr/pTyr-binding forkhead associated (FHA) protein/V8-like Glu-specific endopeptidase